MTDWNDPLPWDELALSDLRYCLEHGESVEEAAEFLCRSVDAVRAKATELGLSPSFAPDA